MYYMEPDVMSKSSLNWEVFVTPGIPVASSDVPPGQKQRTYSPISSTLIYGKHDAVLVDTLLTVEQSNDFRDDPQYWSNPTQRAWRKKAAHTCEMVG
jgi:hypothetical protein